MAREKPRPEPEAEATQPAPPEVQPDLAAFPGPPQELGGAPAGARLSRYVVVNDSGETVEFGADARVFVLDRGRNPIGENPDGSAWLNGVDCPGWTPVDLWKQAQSAFLGRRHGISFLVEEF